MKSYRCIGGPYHGRELATEYERLNVTQVIDDGYGLLLAKHRFNPIGPLFYESAYVRRDVLMEGVRVAEVMVHESLIKGPHLEFK